MGFVCPVVVLLQGQRPAFSQIVVNLLLFGCELRCVAHCGSAKLYPDRDANPITCVNGMTCSAIAGPVQLCALLT